MKNVVQLKPQSLPQSGLHPSVVVCIIRRGETIPANSMHDLNWDLTITGAKRAQQLGVTFDAVGVRARFNYIVCSADKGSRRTAKEMFHQYGKTPWVEGTGRQLYAPENDADFALMQKMRREFDARRAIKFISSPSYNVYKLLDTEQVFDRFMKETRQLLLSLPDIASAHRIAIVSHNIICNAIAEALFPQHKREIEEIELGPCDFMMLSEKECRYFPLIPLD